jgi:hypothetical protein
MGSRTFANSGKLFKMKARDVLTERQNQELDELLGPIAGAVGSVARGLGTAGGVALKGLGKIASAPLTGLAKGMGGRTGQVLNTVGKGLEAGTDAAGNAVKNVGSVAGNALGGTAPSTPAPPPTDAEIHQTFKPGTEFDHPKLGKVKVLPTAPGEKGITLDTTQILGQNITIDPSQFTQQS